MIILNSDRAMAQYQSRDMNFKFGEHRAQQTPGVVSDHCDGCTPS